MIQVLSSLLFLFFLQENTQIITTINEMMQNKIKNKKDNKELATTSLPIITTPYHQI